ncbi:hypothetical protein IWW55_003499, partial [Coemansia sp. RSA 2706]
MQRIARLATQAAGSRRGLGTSASSSSSSDDARVWSAQGRAPPIAALDAAGMELVRRRLGNALARGTPQHMQFKWSDSAGDAAVLMLLCTVDGRASVLFEERNNRLAAHGGEVCFAGGKADARDASLEHTALRETREELGLQGERICVLGRLPPVPNQARTLRVHMLVGAVAGHELDVRALPVNRAEVHRAFALPLDHFYDARRRELMRFRDTDVRIPTYASDKPGLR